MNFIAIITLASFLIPTALAAPAARDECHPNFSGRSVSIFSSSRLKEWGPGSLDLLDTLEYKNPSSEVGEFKIPFTGQYDSSYFIKPVEDNELYAGLASHIPNLRWVEYSPWVSMQWLITCAWCAPGDATFWNSTYATGCTIATPSGICVDDMNNDSVIRVNTNGCSGSPTQLWEFVLPRP